LCYARWRTTPSVQDRKQPISPHLQFKLRLATQQVVQLSGTQTRPTLTFLLNEVGNFLIQNQTSCIGAIAFVVSLSAYLQALASPADAQVLDWFMREELPGRFFTTERP
jgi:hypothetical protein